MKRARALHKHYLHQKAQRRPQLQAAPVYTESKPKSPKKSSVRSPRKQGRSSPRKVSRSQKKGIRGKGRMGSPRRKMPVKTGLCRYRSADI